jgi:hypothetical protein
MASAHALVNKYPMERIAAKSPDLETGTNRQQTFSSSFIEVRFQKLREKIMKLVNIVDLMFCHLRGGGGYFRLHKMYRVPASSMGTSAVERRVI